MDKPAPTLFSVQPCSIFESIDTLGLEFDQMDPRSPSGIVVVTNIDRAMSPGQSDHPC
jgi:hypothetical protein